MMTARYREVRRYLHGEVDCALLERVAGACGMRVEETSESLVRLRVVLKFWSFGEVLDIGLGAVDGKCVVDVTSRCRLKTQLADWGKNERNVRRVFEEIDKLLGDGCAYERCSLCVTCGYLLVGISSGVCPECGQSFSEDDEPATQEVATVRNALVLACLISAVEVALVVLLDLAGIDVIFLRLWGVAWVIPFLLLTNALGILSAVAVHRIVKPFLRRR